MYMYVSHGEKLTCTSGVKVMCTSEWSPIISSLSSNTPPSILPATGLFAVDFYVSHQKNGSRILNIIYIATFFEVFGWSRYILCIIVTRLVTPKKEYVLTTLLSGRCSL